MHGKPVKFLLIEVKQGDRHSPICVQFHLKWFTINIQINPDNIIALTSHIVYLEGGLDVFISINLDSMHLRGFGCLLRLGLLFGTPNPLYMALFSTVVTNLFLVNTIVYHMCVPTTAVVMGVIAGFVGVGLLCSVNLSTRGTELELSSLCNPEPSQMAVSVAATISTL